MGDSSEVNGFVFAFELPAAEEEDSAGSPGVASAEGVTRWTRSRASRSSESLC